MNRDNLADLRKDYQKEVLTIDMLHKDPMKQFSIWFEQALASDEPEPNAMVLSTVGLDLQPSARVVLVKDITKQGLVFYTNYQSKKGLDLNANSKCALTFWWRTLQQQVRIQGSVEKIADEASSLYFARRPLGSQLSAAASPQSAVIPNRSFLEKRIDLLKAGLSEEEGPERPPHWGGYIVKPNRLEFWQGRASRLHDRFSYVKSDESWEINRLAP